MCHTCINIFLTLCLCIYTCMVCIYKSWNMYHYAYPMNKGNVFHLHLPLFGFINLQSPYTFTFIPFGNFMKPFTFTWLIYIVKIVFSLNQTNRLKSIYLPKH
jgi:hypothetical protein